MIKTLSKSIREFKKPAILTPILVVGEVVLECIIPFVIANLVNEMQAGCGMDVIIQYGLQLSTMEISPPCSSPITGMFVCESKSLMNISLSISSCNFTSFPASELTRRLAMPFNLSPASLATLTAVCSNCLFIAAILSQQRPFTSIFCFSPPGDNSRLRASLF